MSRQDMGVTSDDHPRVTRRAAIGGALSLGALSVLLAACGGDDDDDAVEAADGPGTTGGVVDDISVNPPFTILQGNSEYLPGESRLALGILRNRADGNVEPLGGAEVLIGFSPIDTSDGSAPEAAEYVPMTFHSEGLAPQKAYYAVRTTFTQPGPWMARIHVGDEVGELPFNVIDPAAPTYPLTPAIGAEAPRTPTPTTTDTLDVDPICTRTDADGNVDPCPLHSASLADAIGNGPVVVTFSTPARCTSQVCGPTLELLIDEYEAEPGITFVHVEIFQNSSSNQQLAAIDSALPGTWSLVSEPWLFAIDADGIVQAKLEGVFDAAEIRDLVATVAPA
jgi:hypothetical protein